MAELDDLLREVDAAVDEIVRFHQDIVRIPTVNTGQMPTGNETACCEYIRDRLGAEGIGAKILESAPGRGNLIARLKGDGSGPSLLLMSHLDVVPVEDPARWRYPPFEAVLAEGRIWGRGSDDAKAVATAGYFATVLLKRSGLRLKGDLIYTATADEESGGFYGYGWLARNAPEEIRADYALNEGGGYPVRSRWGLVYEVGIGEKGRVEATITIGGRSGHASRPWDADNALLKAGRVLNLIENYRPEIDLSSPVFDYLHEIDAGLGRPRPETLEETLARVKEIDPQLSSLLRALSRMTLTPTVLHAGVKSNSIPASATLKCDVRTLPGQDENYVRAELEKLLAGIEGVSFEVETWARSTQSPFGTPFTGVLRRALAAATGREDVRLIPALTAGFTDSQWVRPLGVAAYGFAPIHPESETVRPGVHGIDENFAVRDLVIRTKAYLAAAYFTLVEGL
jgi:acetylornithine deacetylase/succinyl-diaminopimelate desuccinylase-like protein